MPDIYLWSVPSDANANDVRLRDPTTAGGATNYQIDAQRGIYSLSGQAITVSRNRVATVLNGTYILIGQALTVSRNRVATPTNGTYALTGQAITVNRNRVATPVNGVYSLAGQAATVLRSKLVTAQSGTYTLTGQTATVSRNRVATPSNGAYALSGQVIEVVYTPSAVNYQINAQAGSYTVSGQSIAVSIAASSPGGAGSSNQRKHRRIHPREIWEEPEQIEEVAEKAATVAKKLKVRGEYAEIPLPDLEYAIAKLEEIVGADYDEDDVEALLLLI